MPTIRDIADRLGVSVSTVSKGLHGAKDISEEMRQQVLDAAVQIGYAPKHTLRLGNSKMCILIDDMEYDNINKFGYEIIVGFKMAAARRHCQVDVIQTVADSRQAQKYDSFLLQEGYRGAFLLGFSLDDIYSKQLALTTYPSVILDAFIPGNKKAGYVGTDNFEGIDLAVSHLIDYGHRKIGFINLGTTGLAGVERELAFIRCVHKYGLAQKANWNIPNFRARLDKTGIIQSMLEDGVTAFVCATDRLAQEVLGCLRLLGKRVPDDCSIVGYDDLPFTEQTGPGLTTVRQDRVGIGKSAFIMLEQLMNDVAVSKMLLRPELIQRNSVGRRQDTR